MAGLGELKAGGTKAENREGSVKKRKGMDFPSGIVDKSPPANAGDTGSIPGPGRSHTCHREIKPVGQNC